MQTDIIYKILKEVGYELITLKKNADYEYAIKGIDFKSNADIIAERIIKENLKKISNFPVVSEEDSASWKNINEENYWLIDPIDGTASFCQGFKGYVTQLAFMKNNRPIYGAVYAPEFNLFFHAIENHGAFCNRKKINPQDIDNFNLKLIDNYPKVKGIAKDVFDKFNCVEYLESGSLGLKICRIAQGYSDIFIKDVNMKTWDLAPGDILLRELGSFVMDLNGKKIDYSKFDVQNGMVCCRDLNLSEKIIKYVNEK